MSIAGYQNGWLADIAADYCTAAVRIGDRKAKRTSRHTTVRIGNAGRIGSRSQTGEGCAAGHPGVGNAIDCDRVRRRTAADCDGHTAIITAVATCRGGRFRGRDRCWNSDGHRSACLLAITTRAAVLHSYGVRAATYIVVP